MCTIQCKFNVYIACLGLAAVQLLGFGVVRVRNSFPHARLIVPLRACRLEVEGVPIRLCNYHVQMACLENLVAYVPGNKVLRMEMFKDLRAIQALHDPQGRGKEFMDELQAFNAKFGVQAPAFIDYFHKEWVASGKMGAYWGVEPAQVCVSFTCGPGRAEMLVYGYSSSYVSVTGTQAVES
jgi:hypothetical protein